MKGCPLGLGQAYPDSHAAFVYGLTGTMKFEGDARNFKYICEKCRLFFTEDGQMRTY